MSDLVMQRRIAAPPPTVFAFLTEKDKLLQWFGVDARLDPRVGGRLRIDVTGGDVVEGEYLEVTPHERVVFSWGWVDNQEVPPGASTVTFDLLADGEGTLLTLTHAHLPDDAAEPHAKGWTYFLGRLGAVGAGEDVGPVSLEEMGSTEPRLTIFANETEGP